MLQGREQLKKPVHDFKEGVVQAKEQREKAAKERSVKHRQTIADRRRALDKKRASFPNQSTHTRPVTQSESIVARIVQQGKTSTNAQEYLTRGVQDQFKQSKLNRKVSVYKERPEVERKQNVQKVMKRPDKPIKVIKKRKLQKRSTPINRRERQ